jgi:hypothetical protein
LSERRESGGQLQFGAAPPQSKEQAAIPAMPFSFDPHRPRRAGFPGGATGMLWFGLTVALVGARAQSPDAVTTPTRPAASAQTVAHMPQPPAASVSEVARATTPPPPPNTLLEPDFRPRLPRDLFEAQIALMRDAICPGPIDGLAGAQTRNALYAFQIKHGLSISGILDNDTRAMLQLREPPLTTYTVTETDLASLRPWPSGWEEKSRLDRLGHSTVLELVAEKSWTHPQQIIRLNPQITDWEHVPAGTVVAMPHVFRAQPSTRPMRILIRLSAKTLQV